MVFVWKTHFWNFLNEVPLYLINFVGPKAFRKGVGKGFLVLDIVGVQTLFSSGDVNIAALDLTPSMEIGLGALACPGYDEAPRVRWRWVVRASSNSHPFLLPPAPS